MTPTDLNGTPAAPSPRRPRERTVLVLGGGVLLVYLLFWLPYKGMQLTYFLEDPD